MDYEIIASGAGGNTSTPDYEILAKGVPISSGKEFKQRNMLSDAWEGLGITTGATDDISESVMNNPIYTNPVNRRWGNIQEAMTAGAENAARETGANVLDMVGGMVPGAEGLWDTADKIREPIPENSVGKLFGDIAVGGIGGRTAGMMTGITIKNPIARTASFTDRIKDANTKMKNSTDATEILGLAKKKNKFVNDLQNPPRLPIVNVATKIPVVGSAIGKVWDKVIGDIIDVPLSHLSDAAAARRVTRITETLKDANVKDKDIGGILSDYFNRNPKVAPKSFNKNNGSVAAAVDDMPTPPKTPSGWKMDTPVKSPEPTAAATRSAFEDIGLGKAKPEPTVTKPAPETVKPIKENSIDELFGIKKKTPVKPASAKPIDGKKPNSIFVPKRSQRSIDIYHKNEDEIVQLRKSLPGTLGDKRKSIENKIDALYRESNVAEVEDFPNELKKANKINDDTYRDIVKIHNKGNGEATDIVTNKYTDATGNGNVNLDNVDEITKEMSGNKYKTSHSSPAIDFSTAKKVISKYLKSGGKLSIAGLAIALGTSNQEAEALYNKYNNTTQLKDIGL